jgi:hypothetical protein
MFDPRDLIRKLQGQGWKKEGETSDNGVPVYWMIGPDRERYSLRGSDLDLLEHRGKLDLAGVRELDVERKRQGKA